MSLLNSSYQSLTCLNIWIRCVLFVQSAQYNNTLIISWQFQRSLQTLYLVFLCSSLLSCVSGEKGTLTHGSVVDGRFEGFIKSHQGMYYVEPSERYLQGKNVPFHSVIYHEDDISKYNEAEQEVFKLYARVE